MKLEECLPDGLRGPQTKIERTSAGLSGAGVYRVQGGDRTWVLKIASEGPVDAWRRVLQVQRQAAEAGLAPRVVHVDEDRRAVVTEHVADRSFPALYLDPRTQGVALEKLAHLLRGVHALSVPGGAEPREPRAFLSELWSRLRAKGATPAFVAEAVDRVLNEPPPPSDRPMVLSHNDPNPTNLIYDGEQLLLLDWDASGPNDAYFDLAAVSVFLRMDAVTCLGLLSLHDGVPVASLPARFEYMRRLAAALPGVAFLRMAVERGGGDAKGGTLASAPTLAECYQRMRTGALNPATAEGQWALGLALIKESAAP